MLLTARPVDAVGGTDTAGGPDAAGGPESTEGAEGGGSGGGSEASDGGAFAAGDAASNEEPMLDGPDEPGGGEGAEALGFLPSLSLKTKKGASL